MPERKDNTNAGRRADALAHFLARLPKPTSPVEQVDITPAAPSAAVLVRYLAGQLPEEVSASVENRLTRNPASRQTLRSVRAHLQRFEELLPSAVEHATTGNGLAAEVAREWLAVSSARAVDSASARAEWAAQGWLALRRERALGLDSAHAAWAAFRGFAKRALADCGAPRPALARGDGDGEADVDIALSPELSAHLPGGLAGSVHEAEIDPAGTLRLWLMVPAQDVAALPPVPPPRLLLSLAYGGESWPLEWVPLVGGQAIWNLTSFAREVGLPLGRVSLAPFRFLLA